MSPHPETIAPGTDPTLAVLAGTLQQQRGQGPTTAPEDATAPVAADRYTSQARDDALEQQDALMRAIRAFVDRHRTRTAAQRAAEARVPHPLIAGSISAAQVSMSPESVKLAVAVAIQPLAAQNLAPLDAPWAPAPKLPQPAAGLPTDPGTAPGR